MRVAYWRDQLLLFVGDCAALFGALWLALFIRHFTLPSIDDAILHLPFLFLFACSILIFISVGLYDRRTALFEKSIAESVLDAQIIIFCIAVAFFFFAPVSVQPKTILALYFVFSTALIIVWRFGVFRAIQELRPSLRVVIVGDGPDIDELAKEIRSTPRARFELLGVVSCEGAGTAGSVDRYISQQTPDLAVVDRRCSYTPRVPVLDAAYMYESLFDRVALTLIDPSALTRTSPASIVSYAIKRVIDSVISVFLLCVLISCAPIVYFFQRIEGPGPLFIAQERIGKGWTRIRVYKFRTMIRNESASSSWIGESENRVTRVGALLRKASIDELPQVISVLTGALSLIGPRSDIVGLGERLQDALPLYRLRYAVTPGISGWAQVNQKYAPGNISPQSLEESRIRLQYDLYYVRHRSLLLDLSITLKTARTIARRLLTA